MTQKIEVIGNSGSIKGPWTIKIGDAVIENVEEYEVWHDDDYVHRVSFTVLTNNFHIGTEKPTLSRPKANPSQVIKK